MTIKINTFIEEAKKEMSGVLRTQNENFDKIYFSKLLETSDQDVLNEAYQEYVKTLNGFDANAFQKFTQHILQQDEDTLDKFATKFASTSEYLIHRNNFDVKAVEIARSDSSSTSKQESINMLDRLRTRAHNKVIDLFNEVNLYAAQNDLAPPYLTDGGPFSPHDLRHRAHVADVLTNHTTIMEAVHYALTDKLEEKGHEFTRNQLIEKLAKGKTIMETLELGHKSYGELAEMLDDLSQDEDELKH